jgi:hypothetical protein
LVGFLRDLKDPPTAVGGIFEGFEGSTNCRWWDF